MTENLLRKLAKSVRYQNLFSSAKDLKTLKIFENDYCLSKIQSIFLSYLYFYDSLFRDIVTEKISKHVTDNEVYEDSYALYKRENIKKSEDKKSNVKLVVSDKIIFPKKEK